MRVSAIDLVSAMREHELRVFTTGDLRRITGLGSAAAAKALARLEARGIVWGLKRGLWANRLAPGLHPYEAAAPLRAPWPCYVSLYSVLSDAGVIAEIPSRVFAVSPAIPRPFRTPLGDYDIHHLPPRLMFGFETRRRGEASFPIADPEKAFLDMAYLSLIPRSRIGLTPRRTRRWSLNRERVRAYARRFAFPKLEALLRRERLL